MVQHSVSSRDPLLDTTGVVAGCYEREFYTFSNFSSFQVEWRGRLWPTSEHAYQAAHFFETAPELVEQIFDIRSAHEAFVLAKSNARRALKTGMTLGTAIVRRWNLDEMPRSLFGFGVTYI